MNNYPEFSNYLIELDDGRIVSVQSTSDPCKHPSLFNRVKSVVVLDNSEENK